MIFTDKEVEKLIWRHKLIAESSWELYKKDENGIYRNLFTYSMFSEQLYFLKRQDKVNIILGRCKISAIKVYWRMRNVFFCCTYVENKVPIKDINSQK